MNGQLKATGTLGTAAVFLTAISTILGAIMFLRFGYAVANVGFVGTLAIILLGHAVTIPTAMALAEIATNQKVEGGGEYFIISRTFGLIPGAAIGISLFLSQAVSVAFYAIAFAEAFRPVFAWLGTVSSVQISDARVISLPAVILLGALVIHKGADLGIKLLYGVVGILFLSLILFFVGKGQVSNASNYSHLFETVRDPDHFFLVFAICFPAFTGMTAGVGLSGDLRDSRKAIPLGTLSATLIGMLVYIGIAYKLAISATPQDLAGDQLVMSSIALWGPIIPIGLACATISSALGSGLVAPRTLQALAADKILPLRGASDWLAIGTGPRGEPRNASMIVFGIALVFVLMGDVDFVAQVISMFFMVTYGAICLISFLEHFAADPSYRPAFRSKWYISLFGAGACLWLMFKMSLPYAIVAILVMAALYLWIGANNPDRKGLASIFQGAIFQISRQLQIFLQKSGQKSDEGRWRPAVVCISAHSFERLDAFNLLRWIAHRFGFGSYIHYLQGYLSRETVVHSRDIFQRLVRLTDVSRSNIYIDTLISPSYTTAVAQVAQLPGISGKENNLVLFEFSRQGNEDLADIIDNYRLMLASGFDVCILGSTSRDYGYRREIHVWITPEDFDNVSLMILLAYIIIGHPDWEGGQIKLFAAFPETEIDEQKDSLHLLIKEGRLPISARNIELMATDAGTSRRELIRRESRDADLIILGFIGEALQHQKEKLFEGYDDLGNILWVNTKKEILINREQLSSQNGTEQGTEGQEEMARTEAGEEGVPAIPKPGVNAEEKTKNHQEGNKRADEKP
ncbi:MAG: amino acid permease [Proteobacteria bacterium]|nr:amino acid permease [Pseudomonadota bacterium]MBU1710416.1 amino acid permease [Pseudomonadota bacterium]